MTFHSINQSHHLIILCCLFFVFTVSSRAPSINRFPNTSFFNTLAVMRSSQHDYWVGAGSGGHFMVTATDVLYEDIQPYAAYQFDQSGLIVDYINNPIFTLANVKHGGALEDVRTWTWNVDPKP